jgi:EpsI family protein
MMRFWTTILLLLMSLGAYGLSLRRNPDSLAEPLDAISSRLTGWTQTQTQQLPPRMLDRLIPTSYLSRTYSKGSNQLGLFIAYYAQQRAGESMHSPKHCLPGGGWEIWQYGSAIIPVNNQPTKINQYFIQNAGRRMVVFYWYQSRDRIIADEYLGKILLMRDTLLAGHTAGAIVRITVPDVPGAADEALAFAHDLVPEVQRCFGSMGAKSLGSQQ